MATRSVEDHRMPARILLVEDEEALLLLLRYPIRTVRGFGYAFEEKVLKAD
jgi:hypothetical protein